MPKRKREVHRGHSGRKRRKEAQERLHEAREEKERHADTQPDDPDLPDGDFVPFNLSDNAAPEEEQGGGDGDYHHDKQSKARMVDTREFFGMLADEEQEYFRRADELLELNDFPSPEERAIFLENVFQEAQGKELKLASSQSCSRLMERLILLSDTAQKKRLFDAFAEHFPTLVTHRFGSHCCEQLFVQSAPIVTKELGEEWWGDNGSKRPQGAMGDKNEDDGDGEKEEQPEQSMETLFLLVLDEIEEHLPFLMTDVFGSHAVRVLLTVLSGRPLDEVATKSLLQSRKKEQISVAGAPHAPAAGDGMSAGEILQRRSVPASFGLAVQKIIDDMTSSLDTTALGVLVKHPTGNPVLQLLLELDIALNTKSKERKKKTPADGEQAEHVFTPPTTTTLLEKLLPDAPSSLADGKSVACVFVNSAIYDPIASRLLETLITHCPGKIFKALHANILGPRMGTMLRNETATYSLIRALNRLSKEDLTDAADKALPHVNMLLRKGRFNVLTTMFERCGARKASAAMDALLQSVVDACLKEGTSLVRRLCFLDDGGEKAKEKQGDDKEGKGGKGKAESILADTPKKKDDLVRNGTKLATAMVTVGGGPAQAIQASLLFLEPANLLRLATSSAPTAKFLAAALRSPSAANPLFHKLLVTALAPHAMELAQSDYGHRVLCAVALVPSKGEGFALPFFMKQRVVTALEANESALRATWTGRKVWREWRGDLWVHRRGEWVSWAREVDPEGSRKAGAPGGRVESEVVGKGKVRGRERGRGGVDEKVGKKRV